jgi:aspartate/methionine/tyrosine aminotransferase
MRNLDRIVGRNRSIVSRNLALFERFLAERPGFAAWTPPEGSSIGFPRLADGSDSEALAKRLVSESGVLILPGAYYGYDHSYFRVGYGRANMPEALERLGLWLDAQPGGGGRAAAQAR